MSEMHRYGIEEEGRAVPDKNGWLVDYDDHVDYVVEVALAERQRAVNIIRDQVLELKTFPGETLEDFAYRVSNIIQSNHVEGKVQP